MPRFCTYCGAKNSDDAKYCKECGKQIGTSDRPACWPSYQPRPIWHESESDRSAPIRKPPDKEPPGQVKDKPEHQTATNRPLCDEPGMPVPAAPAVNMPEISPPPEPASKVSKDNGTSVAPKTPEQTPPTEISDDSDVVTTTAKPIMLESEGPEPAENKSSKIEPKKEGTVKNGFTQVDGPEEVTVPEKIIKATQALDEPTVEFKPVKPKKRIDAALMDMIHSVFLKAKSRRNKYSPTAQISEPETINPVPTENTRPDEERAVDTAESAENGKSVCAPSESAQDGLNSCPDNLPDGQELPGTEEQSQNTEASDGQAADMSSDLSASRPITQTKPEPEIKPAGEGEKGRIHSDEAENIMNQQFKNSFDFTDSDENQPKTETENPWEIANDDPRAWGENEVDEKTKVKHTIDRKKVVPFCGALAIAILILIFGIRMIMSA